MRTGKTLLDPVVKPLERLTYRLMGVDPGAEHDWKQYTLAMLLFSLVGLLFTYLDPALQASAAAQSAEAWPAERPPRVQHRGQLHDQHQLAELRRRSDDVVLLADGRR